MSGFKKYIAKLLIVYVFLTNAFPATAFASQPVNSVLAQPVVNEQSTPPQDVQPVAALPQHSSRFSSKLSVLALASNDGKRQSAHFRSGVSVQKLEKRDFKADEDVTLLLNNPDQEKYKTKVMDAAGKEVTMQLHEEVQDDITQLQVIPTNQFQPGKYTISVTDETGKTTKQDFSWGVLALNPDKAIYHPNETSDLSMAVLDDRGAMVCDAQVELRIENAEWGMKDTLSTENGKITVNPECNSHAFTLKPDYEAHYNFGGVGKYDLILTAKTRNGNHTISDQISVQNATPFVIQRTSATRIYPPNEYPMQFNITANRDFTGTVTETVPDSFVITPSDGNKSYDSMKTVYLNNNDPSAVLGASTGGLVMPFDGKYPITQGFGTQLTDPGLQAFYSHYGLGGHDGIDFGLPMGTPLYAVDDGKIVWSGPGDYGIQIIIQHSWGKTYYGHMTKTSVEKDVDVKKGSLIGYSGMTGEATGPHLHFGMKPDNADMSNGYAGKVDPMPFLPIGAGKNAAAALQQAGFNSVLGASTSAEASPSAGSITPTPIQETTTASSSAQFSVDAVSQESAENQPQTMVKTKVIKWHVSLKKGDKINLSYNFKTPQISPQFYLVGSLKFYENTKSGNTISFDEGRQWQIAADDIGTGWYHTNGYQGYEWPYRKKLTIDHTKVSPVIGTPAFDAKNTTTGSSVTTLTWTHVTGSGNNRILVVAVADSSSPVRTVSSVTYNNTALTAVTGGGVSTGGTIRSELWYMLAPPTGSFTVNVTLSGSATNVIGGSVSFSNVDQATPLGTATTNTGTGASSSVPITLSSTQVGVESLGQSGAISQTVKSGQTQIGSSITSGGSSYGPGSGGAMGWTYGSGSAGWTEAAVPVNGASTDQLNFPVLVNITDTDLKNHIGQSNANDLLFTDSNGMTKLSHEIESYTSATGTLNAWVKIPSLSATTDTNIYMYYGNGSIAAQEDPASTWSNGYIAVYHMSDGGCGSGIYQSVANNSIAACVNTPTNVTGQIGNAFSFSGTNYIDANTTSLTVKGLSGVTANAWVKPAANQNESIWAEPINLNTNYRYQFAISTTGKAKIFGRAPDNASSATWVNTTATTTLNAWNFAGCTYNATGGAAMCTLNTSSNTTSSALSAFDNTNPNITPRIGNGPTTDPFNGAIDELQISNVDRGANWLTTVYNNQSDPSGFIPTIGSEEGKIYSATPDQYMRHGKFFDTSGNNYGKQPFMF